MGGSERPPSPPTLAAARQSRAASRNRVYPPVARASVSWIWSDRAPNWGAARVAGVRGRGRGAATTRAPPPAPGGLTPPPAGRDPALGVVGAAESAGLLRAA